MTTITASPKQLSSLPSNQRRTRSMGKIYSKEQDNPEETNNNNKRPTPSYCTKTEEFSVSINSPSKKRRTSQTPAAAKKVVDTFNQEVSNPIVSPVNQVTYKSDEDTNDDIEETDDNISNNIDDPYDNKDISSSYDLNDEQLSPPSPSPSAAFLRQREGFVGNSRHNYLSSPTADVSMTGINTSEVYGYMNGDEDEDKDGTHYSEFGWPDMDPTATHDANNNSNSTNNISCGRRNSNHLNSSEEFFSIQGNNHQQHQHSTSFFSDRPLQRSLLQDFLQADDYVQGDGGDSEQPISGQQPIDEVDMFFSASQADYVSMSFSTKLSIPQQRQQFLALAKPTYLTSWPHFLTLDYFDTHDAHDRSDIVPPSPPPSSNHQENSDNGNDTMTPILSTASYFDTKFSVLHRIGTGEYADVWKVWNIESNEVFAIKKLKVPFQSFSDRWQQLVEVRNMLMVQHSSYCLNLFSAWEQDGYLYLQTDIAVATLADYLQDEQETIDESITWHMIYQMAMGLQDIHHAGLVHMDLKPSNIMIDANGILKIGDFGTSIRRPLDAYEFKGEGDRHYMAPDLLREEYDAPADVFSLGLIIFEMVTRVQLPSTGDSWEMLRLGDFSNYKQQLITVPLEIRRIMLMMLKPSSRERATIDEILAVPYLQRIATNQQDPGPLYDYAQLLDQE